MRSGLWKVQDESHLRCFSVVVCCRHNRDWLVWGLYTLWRIRQVGAIPIHQPVSFDRSTTLVCLSCVVDCTCAFLLSPFQCVEWLKIITPALKDKFIDGLVYQLSSEGIIIWVERGDSTALSQVIQNALDYATLLREHIQKEDNIIFPMADNVIPVGQHQQLMAEFNRIEHEDDVHEKYLRIADELAKAVTA